MRVLEVDNYKVIFRLYRNSNEICIMSGFIKEDFGVYESIEKKDI